MAETRDTKLTFTGVDNVSPAIKQITTGLNNVAQVGRNVKIPQGLNDILKIATGVGLGTTVADVLIKAGAAARQFVQESVNMAAAMGPVSTSFERMSAAAGQSSSALLSAMDAAAQGTVSRLELMKQANYAMMTIGTDVADKLPKMMEVARAAAMATGQSVEYMFQSITMGTARQSKLILDNLGILVDAKKAYADYGASIGVAADKLTEQQKKVAFLNAVMEAGDTMIQRVGASQGGLAQVTGQLSAKMNDLKAAVGGAFLGAMYGSMSIMAGFVGKLAEATQQGQPLRAALDSIGKAAQDMQPLLQMAFEWLAVTGIPAIVNATSAAAKFAATLATNLASALNTINASAQAGREQIVSQYDTWEQYRVACQRAGEQITVTREEFIKLKVAMMEFGTSAGSIDYGRWADDIRGIATAAKQLANVPPPDPKVWEDWGKKLQDTVNTGMDAVRATMDKHYQQMADAASQAQLDAIRSEAEYNAERARLVASGNNEAVAKLDASFKKEKILRDLNNRISSIQTQAKYKAELEAQKTAMIQKIAMMIAESSADKRTKDIMLSVLKSNFKNINIENAQYTADFLELAKTRVDGSNKEVTQLLNNTQAYVNGLKAAWQAQEQLASGGGSATNWDQYQNEINKAYEQIGNIATDIGGGGSPGSTAGSSNPAADLAAMVDRMLADIASIGERLQQDLPQINADKVRAWLDRLADIGRIVGEYMQDPARGMKDFVKWLDKDIRPMVEKWVATAGPIADLLGSAASIMDTLAGETKPVGTSVETFLKYLKGAMYGVADWLKNDKGWEGYVAAWDTNLRPIVEHWLASMKPIADLLDTAGSIMETLSVKAQGVKTPVVTFLNYLKGAMQAVAAYFAQGDGGWVGYVDYYNTNLRPMIEKWVAAVKPIAELLDTAKSIFEALAMKVPSDRDIQNGIAPIFNAINKVNEAVNFYYKWMVAYRPAWQDLTQATKDWLESVRVSTGAVADAVSNAKAILDALGLKVPSDADIKAGIAPIFNAIKAVIEAVNFYHKWMVAYRPVWPEMTDATKEWLVSVDAAVKPIAAVFSGIGSIFKSLGEKLPEAKTTVADMLNRAKAVLEEVIAQISATETGWPALIAKLDEETRTQMANVETAIKSVSESISSTVGMLTALGMETKPFNAVKLQDLLNAIKLAIGILVDTFAGVELDTERLKAIEESASAVRGVLNAMDGMAKMIKDINIPDNSKIAQLVAALGGGTFGKQTYTGIIPQLESLPTLSSGAKTTLENLAAGFTALTTVISRMSSIAYSGNLDKLATDTSSKISNLLTGLTTILTNNQAKIDSLKTSAETFGTNVKAALDSIVLFWNVGDEKVNVSTILGEFSSAVTAMVATTVTELGKIITYMGPQGSFQTGLASVDLAAVVKGLFGAQSPFMAALNAVDLSTPGYNIGRSLVSGIQSGANSMTVTVTIYTSTQET